MGTRTTTNYSRFGTIEGNRRVSRRHVKELKRLIRTNGNLNEKFPIKVNSRMEILDGQHRFEALKELGLPIVYEIVDGANINTVRAINLGNKNWDWRDIGRSYADLGNKEYEWFLDYVDQYGINYGLAMAFCDQPIGRGYTSRFYAGRLNIEDKPKAVQAVEHYLELRQFVPHVLVREFGLAVNTAMRAEGYSGEQMVRKMSEHNHLVPAKATRVDFLRALEDIYNHSMANRLRLF